MITCPWCGTSYVTFQPNCGNCGGPLQAVDENTHSSVQAENISAPPPAPRPISERYVWRLLSSDGGWIAALVLGLMGLIFSLVGGGLTIGVVTAFVGIPFLVIGIVMLMVGGWLFERRYQAARQVVDVLREGTATQGLISEVQENYSVVVNGRHPWMIRYQFQANGQSYAGSVTTLNQPGPQLQAGRATYVLYLPVTPRLSTIYPHP